MKEKEKPEDQPGVSPRPSVDRCEQMKTAPLWGKMISYCKQPLLPQITYKFNAFLIQILT